MWPTALLLGLQVLGVLSQCSVNIPDAERRDCYPWVNANQADCEALGCVWCAASQEGFPWCFYNDKVCPSDIPEPSRVDCLPEGGDKSACLTKGCLWCETSTAGIPWCFDDPQNSLGGSLCPVDIAESERMDCHPEPGASEATCLARGCYWCQGSAGGAPWCFAPKEYGYRVESQGSTPKGERFTLQRVNTPSWFGADIQTLTLDVEYQENERLRIKFYDSANARFEVPVDIDSPASVAPNPAYQLVYNTDPVFSLQVTRRSTGTVVFDTSMGGLTFADQFIQISTRLNSGNVYGFGEHEHTTFRHDMNWVSWGMWSRDQATTTSNLYGVQPFYVNVEQDGNAHGVLFLNANAQDVTLMPTPGLTYRTIGGVLDIYMFFGPEPNTVVQQFNAAVGNPVMVPYWALGFQLCRWGYQTLDNLKAAVGRMRANDIPHDVQYGDIDYMDAEKDFTIDPINFVGLEAYVDELKTQGTRFVIILDPAIASKEPPGTYPPYDNGNTANIWVMNSDNSGPAEGEVWPGATVYPDYTKPATQDWWLNECQLFKNRLDYAGLWIDMNEPSNFIHGSPTGCNDNKYNYPPYLPRIADDLIHKTLCMDTTQDLGISYNAHSLYGFAMAQQTFPVSRAVAGTRSVVFSRSTFPGAGQWGQHWLGDNWSDWNRIRYSIIGLLEFNMFGMPYAGSDICGFIDNTTEELCRRWQQLGAFYPFSRNHNAAGNTDQDPGIWPTTVAVDTRKTLLIRYRLLPYLYTLHHNAHTQGSTVIRSLMMEFSTDATTYDIQEQMMWGSYFLISPCLYQGATTVQAYFPDARWYNYYDGAEVPVVGTFAQLDSPIDTINLHVKGGAVMPTQVPANSTMFSRNNPLGLIVALDDVGAASGEIFWDDGQSIDTFQNGAFFHETFAVSGGSLAGTITSSAFQVNLNWGEVVVMGAPAGVAAVTVNGVTHGDWTQDGATNQLVISNAGVSVDLPFSVTWS